MTDLYYLSQTDGAGDWREKEAKDLTELVQRRIMYLQVRYFFSLKVNIEFTKGILHPTDMGQRDKLKLSPEKEKNFLRKNQLQ